MARRQIEETYYTFNPTTNTITVPRVIKAERLMLITNVTKNIVIYNFSDPNTGYVSVTQDNTSPNRPGTTIVLEYNCSSMLSTDKLAIVYDEMAETITFEPALLDAVQKLRVAAPQSLMDTDFEYGVQPSKWEALVTCSNYPTFFSRTTGGNSYDIISIAGNGASPRSTVTVTTASNHGLANGDVVSVQETTSGATADGTYPVTIIDSTSFSYQAKGIVSAQSIKDGNMTGVYGGGIYDNAHIVGGNIGGFGSWSAISDQAAYSTITVTTPRPHGLLPGTPILVNDLSSPIGGIQFITNVSTPNQFKFQVQAAAIVSNPINTVNIGLFTRPEGYVDHRPFDGGVILTTANNVCGVQTIRQTRRYFRYQSGKSIQFSTGAKLTPTYDLDTIFCDSNAVGITRVTVTTRQDHGLQPGATIRVENATVTGTYNPWNADFKVTEILGTNSFKYEMLLNQVLPSTDQFPGGTDVKITVVKWKGAATRCGLFDDQNGFYFEYDGAEFHCVRRYTKKELFGRLNLVQYSNYVQGTNTRFRKQLTVGEQITIRGAHYKVIQINSDTEMYISPSYKASTVSSARYLKMETIKVPQSQWNIDKMDGTGPSGYVINPARMQMVYIDYTWYGAGFIRFGFRAADGNIYYCHKMPNNNANTEAYMRSGNLPARYEAVNEPTKFARLVAGGTAISGANLMSTEIAMYVDNVDFWPASGYLMIKDDLNCEIVSYSSIGAYNATARGFLVNIARRQPMSINYSGAMVYLTGTQANVIFSPDQTIPGGSGVTQVSVQPISQECAPVISHWGSSVIMDGRFDDDKAYIFTAGMQRFIQITGSGTFTAKIASRSATGGLVTLTTATTHNIQPGYDVSVSGVNTVASISAASITNLNTANITTAGAHNLLVGQTVQIANVISSSNTIFNGTRVILTTPTSNTFTFSRVYPQNQSFTGLSGTATESSTFNGTFSVTNVSANTIMYNIANSTTFAQAVVASATASQSFGSSSTPRPLVSIRIAPSVDNGLGRNYGIREVVNHMQLNLSSIGILSSGQFLIQGFLNPASMVGVSIPNDWETTRIPGGSLAQVIYHEGSGVPGTTIANPTNTVTGGDQVFAFYTENSGGDNLSVTSFDLSKVRDLGTSILSGNGNQSAPGYPNGPDILTIVATNLGATTGNITCRLSWTEAQA
jgi:hypothetical protein